MSNRNPRQIIPSNGGFFQGLAVRIKLVLRLLADERISLWLKLLPLGSLIYLLVPEPIIGPIDDATVLGLGLVLFVELCPPDIVAEHMADLTKVIPGEWQDVDEDEGDIIDAEFQEKD